MIKSMDFHVEGVLYYNSAKFLLLLRKISGKDE